MPLCFIISAIMLSTETGFIVPENDRVLRAIKPGIPPISLIKNI
ncbi:MAG: hypothetical protein ACRCT1_02250 [Microcoleaceae cyanobacterium]